VESSNRRREKRGALQPTARASIDTGHFCIHRTAALRSITVLDDFVVLKLPLLGGHPPLGLRSTGALTALGPAEKAAFKEILLTRLAITWLNPHVYLDTVFLIGAISTLFPGFGASFAAGAMPFGGRSNRS
jgi:hypothetical protein